MRFVKSLTEQFPSSERSMKLLEFKQNAREIIPNFNCRSPFDYLLIIHTNTTEDQQESIPVHEIEP